MPNLEERDAPEKSESHRFSLGTHKVLKTARIHDRDAKWLHLQHRVFIDESGQERSWEYVERKPDNPQGDTSRSIYIIAFLKRPSSTEVLVELQYRPAIDSICIEFPAGFIKPGESVKQAARRELYTETGYGVPPGRSPQVQKEKDAEATADFEEEPRGGKDVIVKGVSAGRAREPGVTSTLVHRVTMVVPFETDDEEGPAFDHIRNSYEHIVTGSIQLEDLYDNLKELEAREGYCIGTELGAFADGLETSRRLLLEDTDDVED